MKKFLWLAILLPTMLTAQVDIAKREIKVDSLRARVDSLWFFGPFHFKGTTDDFFKISETGSSHALQISRQDAGNVHMTFTNPGTGYSTAHGTDVGIETDGTFRIRQQENKDIEFYTNNSHKWTITKDGDFITGTDGTGIFNIKTAGLYLQGADTLSTKAYARLVGGGGGGGGTWGTITGTLSDQTDLRAALDSLRSDSIAYSTSFPFNRYLTYMSHTLSANDIITINSTGAINQGGGQILMTNDSTHEPVLTSFHLIGYYDKLKTYSLLTFIKMHGLYIVSVSNFN